MLARSLPYLVATSPWLGYQLVTRRQRLHKEAYYCRRWDSYQREAHHLHSVLPDTLVVRGVAGAHWGLLGIARGLTLISERQIRLAADALHLDEIDVPEESWWWER